MNNYSINPAVAGKLAAAGAKPASPVDAAAAGMPSFEETLKQTVEELNAEQMASDRAMADIATGQVRDLHQAAIAITRAENNMKFMLEVRNKAINAYKEISRTQI